MLNRSDSVDAFMAALEHPLGESIDRLRMAVLAGNPGLSEQIKWQAPSFVYAGDDRVTFADPAEALARESDLVRLVAAWIVA